MLSKLFTLVITTVLFAAAQDSQTLERGKPVEREISGKQGHLYRVELRAGECASIAVDQRGIDVEVQVLNKDGTVIAEFDSDARPTGRELVTLVADSEFRIKPRYAKVPAGHYQVEILELRPATEQDRAVYDSHWLATEALDLQLAGKFDAAMQTAERGLALAESVQGPGGAFAGAILYRMADVKRTTGNFAEAARLAERAIALDEKALGRDHPQTALALRSLGQVYMMMSEYPKANRLLEEHLAIIEKTLGPDHALVALGLRLTGLLYEYRADNEHALVALTRAVRTAEKSFGEDDVELIAITHDLANLYSNLEDYDRAQPLFERALMMVEQKYGRESYQLGSVLANLGAIAFAKKEYPRALEYLERGRSIREKTLGSGHPDTLKIADQIADIYHAQGEDAKSAELHQRTLDALMVSAGPYHRNTLLALRGLITAYTAQGDMTHAVPTEKRFDEALEKNIALNLAIGSEREKLAYLRWTSWQTDRVISLHVRQAPDDRVARDLAASVLLERKGRVLDALSGSMRALRERLGEGDRKLLDQFADANTKLANLALGGPGRTPAAAYKKQLAAAEEERDRLEATINSRSAEFRAQSLTVSLASVKAAIPAEAALIEFAAYRPFDAKAGGENEGFGNPRYVAYIIRRDGEVAWKDLGSTQEIDGAVAALREALSDPHRQDVKNVARLADGKIMQPLRSLIGDAKLLLIAPDGELNLIPFETLVDEHGHFLVEGYAIDYLTAGRDLLRMQTVTTARNRPVIFADPLFGEQGRTPPKATRRSVVTGNDMVGMYFAPLGGTAFEGRDIKSLFQDAQLFTGVEASKAALKVVNAPAILHIATHGFFLTAAAKPENIQNPLLRSGLALAGANLKPRDGDDGILTALEASNLDLWGTKIVTLSACETGVGEVKNGEGVYGLRRAFFLAGAETVVMSLWSVSDRVTREIMTAYYTGLKNGLGRGEALRQAQLAMLQRKDRAHPYYWSSFIQSGEWRSLDLK